MSGTTTLLSVRDLTVAFATEDGPVVAVDGVSFSIDAGEALGLIGESGSGKSVAALSILGLLPSPPARVLRGQALFEGEDLLTMPRRALRRLRGRAIGMIFQEPMSSLNPVFPIGEQIAETLRFHEGLGHVAARKQAIALLDRVGIPSPARRLDDYPHQMSGGMRQRVMVAIALACSPRLLIADEPTTALDVTVQAQLLDLLSDLRRERGMAVLLITHNMGVIAEFADRVVVMYAGRVAEEAPVERLFDAPAHPYTRGLLDSTPLLHGHGRRLRAIPGALPAPGRAPPGCRFAPRCARATEACAADTPALASVGTQHRAACIHPLIADAIA